MTLDVDAHPHPVVTAVRLLLVLLPASATIAVTAIVTWLYLRAYVRTIRMTRRNKRAIVWLGLLPRHVALIGISYLILLYAMLADTVHHLHGPFTWRILGYFAASVTGLQAQWDVLRYEAAIRREPIEDL